MMDHSKQASRGFTLLELVVTLVAAVTILAAVAPAVGSLRGEGYNAQSQANLMALGQGRDQYAADNQGIIYTYSWQAGESYTMPNGQVRTPSSDPEAAALQNQEILMRRTGRIFGIHKILNLTSRVPHRRFTHLVVMDYLAGDDDEAFVSPLVADPADGDLLNWQERPLEYSIGSSVPYVTEVPQGYEEGGLWDSIPVLQRWTFASSYQSVPFAWQGDGPTHVYVPVVDTPHLYSSTGPVDLSPRSLSEVAFPSKKVHLHEEFDREQKKFPWFAYDHARPEKLMFDGSINTRPSGEARDSVNPAEPGKVWTQRYIPLHTFPIPVTGMGETTELNMRYRWTEGGLGGVDYD